MTPDVETPLAEINTGYKFYMGLEINVAMLYGSLILMLVSLLTIQFSFLC